ncbi:metallophosphoesterase [bacterium]|nr:metallophosphoesterase [bacterium]
MKKFVIFFSIVLSIYSLINLYIFQAGWSAISPQSDYRVLYSVVFFLVSSSFIVGRILERKALSMFSETLTWIGSFWLAWMLYLFLFAVLFDIFAFVNSMVQFLPENGSLSKPDIAALVTVSTLVIVLCGHVNARFPRVKKLHLNVSKTVPGYESMRIVVASDIHLGTIIGKSRIDKIVRMINRLNPDLVLLPGDVVDEDLAPVIKENLGESFRNIRSKFGVISITGNHEFIGGVGAAARYLRDHGITVLRDETVKIDDRFYVVGRDDRSVNRFNGHTRKTLEELTASLDKRLPIILMDHQPFHLDEAVSCGIDLQLSGHTHHGQLWPLSFITKKVFEVSWGYKKIDNTHIYVSSGVGTWGPPVRVGNKPEIVQIELKFV